MCEQMAERNDVATEYKRFDDVHFDIITQNKILKEKREQIDDNLHERELKTVWMMDSWSASDSLKQRESEILDDREKHQKLNESIVLLYMNILSYQSSKVHSIMKKLEHLVKKNPTLICPADYTVQAFQEWTRTNPKIHAMQSEVLDMLAQKIKLRSRQVEEERTKWFSLQDFTGTMEKIRSQTMFYLERDPLVDADFSLHVSSIAHVEANTFEAERMRIFIRYCWDNQQDADDLGSMYQQFVGALVEHIMTKYGHMRRSGESKSDLTRDQIFAIIEGQLIPHIYSCVENECPDDVYLRSRFEELRNCSQEEIGVKSCYIDQNIQPYHEAILKLKTLSLVKLPTQKLRTIILASQQVMKRMREVCKDKNVAGADEFIDVWVYVTIKAAVPNTFWNVKYLKEFANPKYMLSETGYYLSSLEMASEYIKTLNADQVDHPEKPRYILLFDIESVRSLCRNENTPFQLVCEDTQLPGYEMATTLDMIKNNFRLLKFGCIEKKDSTLKLIKVKISSECSWNLIERYLQLKLFDDIIMGDTEHGMIPKIAVANKTIFRFSMFSEWSHLVTYSTLIHLGAISSMCNQRYVQASSLISENEKLFEQIQEYFFIQQSMDIALEDIVKEIQDCLKKLKYYSWLLPSDGCYSNILQKSLQRFQIDHKKEKNIDLKSFREDGICDSNSFKLLKELVPTS